MALASSRDYNSRLAIFNYITEESQLRSSTEAFNIDLPSFPPGDIFWLSFLYSLCHEGTWSRLCEGGWVCVWVSRWMVNCAALHIAYDKIVQFSSSISPLSRIPQPSWTNKQESWYYVFKTYIYIKTTTERKTLLLSRARREKHVYSRKGETFFRFYVLGAR